MKPKGSLSLVLHAHLPFVRHPEHPEFLEEDWLYEAITETYVPLLSMMTALRTAAVDFRLTLTLTPPLCEMLADPLLQGRYVARVEKLLELSRRQEVQLAGTPFNDAARHARATLEAVHVEYTETFKGDLLGGFRALADDGCLTILTCPATHGLLPLMATDEARRAQIEIGCRNHLKHFGRRPKGIWLSECAYAPGMEHLLEDAGIDFFFMETHGITGALPAPHAGVALPIRTPNGVAAFGRDPLCSRQVWSADDGYPGDPLYREFYRDLGWDLPDDQVARWVHPDGLRRNLGIKFHRITGKVDLSKKEPYVPAWAHERVAAHAEHFVQQRRSQVRQLFDQLGEPGHITAPFDAELFGHWWHEGPRFLDHVLRKLHFDQSEVALVSPEEVLAAYPALDVAEPALSSWGDGGAFQVWLNGKNDWIYPLLHRCEERMVDLAQRFAHADGLTERALAQAARELVLAQSSDWAFIITMGTTVPYAEQRTRTHVERFDALHGMLTQGEIDEAALSALEAQDNAFAEIDPHLYHPSQVRHPGAGSAVTTLDR